MYQHPLFSKTLSVLLLLPVLLSSCDYAIVAAGSVYDKRTKLPVAGATVWEKNAAADSTVTDAKGHFSITSQRGGFYSQRMKIVIRKENYKLRKTTISAKYDEEIKLAPANNGE